MSHTILHKEKLLKRIRRIRGQVEAVERALETEKNAPMSYTPFQPRGAQ
jgi:DNA-binding FrmR family transcriptional regulator